MKRHIEGKRVSGFVEKANLIHDDDIVEVNWSAIGSVSVDEAERFALEILRVCALTRQAANELEITP